ncbi:7240_t:CDS:2, partial [Dentiscutata erythropus]
MPYYALNKIHRHIRGSCGRGGRGRGSRGKEKEHVLNDEPSTLNNEFNDSDLISERETAVSNTSNITSNPSHKILATSNARSTLIIPVYESIADSEDCDISIMESTTSSRSKVNRQRQSKVSKLSEDYNILTRESPTSSRNGQRQSKVTMPSEDYNILRESSTSSQNKANHQRQKTYKDQTKTKKQQKNNINEHSDNDDSVDYFKRTKKPKPLKDMSNIFKVCQWLVLIRPDILVAANQMRNSMYISIDSPITAIPQSEVTTSTNISEDKELARLWHEEMKCLFLRCRNPTVRVIENLIVKIFIYELYSNEAVEIICYSKQVLTDFRSKFNQKIAILIQEFKDRLPSEKQVSTPSRIDMNEYITQEVAEQTLKRYLSSTDMDKLKKYRTMEKLLMLIRKAFKIYYYAYNTKAVKELDYLTIDCKIP